MITDMELLVIRKALSNLYTIGCKVGIVDKEGNEYGIYKLVEHFGEKKKRAAPVHKRGTLSSYLDQYLFMLTDVGDVTDVPMSPLFSNTSKLNSAISAYMCNRYGAGSSKVESHAEENFVRVYRLEGTKND